MRCHYLFKDMPEGDNVVRRILQRYKIEIYAGTNPLRILHKSIARVLYDIDLSLIYFA